MRKITRREFNLLTTKVIAGITLYQFIGCENETRSELTSKENLKKLIIAFGPWTIIDKTIAADFAERFVNAHHLTKNYLQKKTELIVKIANKIPKNSIAMESLDLRKFSVEENELIMNLCKQIYNLVEVRYFISNMPPYGECQVDELFYVKEPL